jgi:transposase
MTVNGIAGLVGEHDTRIWRILHYHVEESRSRRDDSEVSEVGVDETSSKKGHNYISLFVFDFGRFELSK